MKDKSATAKRAKKLHPSDAANAELLARAVRFEIALFLGTGRYARADAATLEAARIEAMRLVAENSSLYRRLPLIYGITAEGRAALVTAN